MARIPVAFIDPLIGDLGAPPHSINYLNDVEEKVVKELREEFPGIDKMNDKPRSFQGRGKA